MPDLLPPLPMTILVLLLLLGHFLWKGRFKNRQAILPLPARPAAAEPSSFPSHPVPDKNRDKEPNDTNNLSPKVQLLRSKLAIAMGSACPIHEDVKREQPDALDEPWCGEMGGPDYIHVVLNNKTFAMSEVEDGELAARITKQPAIDAGENIKLYVNDLWVRQLERRLGVRPGEMSRRQAAAGISPHTGGFLFLRLVVEAFILKKKKEE